MTKSNFYIARNARNQNQKADIESSEAMPVKDKLNKKTKITKTKKVIKDKKTAEHDNITSDIMKNLKYRNAFENI